MELNEAINHCYEKAAELIKEGTALDLRSEKVRGSQASLLKSEAAGCRECANEHKQLASWLEELQTRREQDQLNWIPCSERLPDPDVVVLVSISGTDIISRNEGESLEEALERNFKTKRRIKHGYISAEEGEEGWCTLEGWPMIVAPVAWLPLPFVTPYDTEREDLNDKH